MTLHTFPKLNNHKNALAAGDAPRTPLEEITALSLTSSWINGTYFYGGREKEERGRQGN